MVWAPIRARASLGFKLKLSAKYCAVFGPFPFWSGVTSTFEARYCVLGVALALGMQSERPRNLTDLGKCYLTISTLID